MRTSDPSFRSKYDNRGRHDGVEPHGKGRALNKEEIAQMKPDQPTPKTIVVDDSQQLTPLMTTGGMIDMVKATAETLIRDLHKRRATLKGSDIDDLDKAYKLLTQIKKQEAESNQTQDLGQLMERALKIPELRDAMRKQLDTEAPTAPALETGEDFGA